MSASLVGSEMCIRDRRWPYARGRQAVRDGRGAPEKKGAGAPGWGAVAVSYTHLTLPTICSV
eukprot:9153957-Alexandrium_andersonii.AAC.1